MSDGEVQNSFFWSLEFNSILSILGVRIYGRFFYLGEGGGVERF